MPDVGLITETEMVTAAKNIVKAVKIPVLAEKRLFTRFRIYD